MEFEYKIIYENRVLILTLKGSLTLGARDLMETCIQEIISYRPKLTVLMMKDVESIEQPLLRELTLIQKELRQKTRGFHVVGLKKALRAELLEKAVVRLSELKPNLAVALKATI